MSSPAAPSISARRPTTVIRHSRPAISLQDRLSVDTVLRSGNLVQGQYVSRFEREFGRVLGLDGTVATSSGTAALHLALLALGVGPGDEVLIPTYVCSVVLNAVRHAGAEAVLVDIDPGGANISVQDARRRMTRRTKAIVVAHMFGAPAPMEQFANLDIPLIEDCAQALGAEHAGRPVGTWGAVAIFSFRATKVIATGEGGMLVCRGRALADFARDRRDYDERDDYVVRFNYAMTDIQAALGLSQLARLPAFIARRRGLARFYTSALEGTGVETLTYGPESATIFYRYVLRVEAPDAMSRHLAKLGVEAKRPVYRPLHHYFGRQDFPSAEAAHRSYLSIPLYPPTVPRLDRCRRGTRRHNCYWGAPCRPSRMRWTLASWRKNGGAA